MRKFFRWTSLYLVFLISLGLFPNITFASNGLMDSSWPVFHGDAKLTGQSKYDTSKIGGVVKWKFKGEGQVETSPILDNDGNIYYSDHKCNLYAITPEGKEKWKFNAGEPIISKEWGGFGSCSQSSPAIDKEGTIYFLPMTGNFFAVDKNGKEKWRYPVHTFKNAWPSPAIGADGTIYVGSESYPPPETGKPQEKGAQLYAFNPDGTLKWEYDATGASWVNSTPSIDDDGTIYTTSNDCKRNCANGVFAINPNGTVKWTFLPPNGVLEGSVVIGKDNTLYFTAKGADDPRKANFYAITSEGKEKWKFPLQNGASITPAVTDDGKIYFGDWGGIFYALDLNGKELWRVQTPPAYEALSSSPAVGSDGTIFFGTIAKYFYAYTPEGKEKWKIDLNGSWVSSSPAIGADGTVYFTSVAGELYAIGEGKIDTTKTPMSVTTEKSVSTSASKNNSELPNSFFPFVFAIAAFFAIASAIISAILKKNKLLVIVLSIVGVILIVFSLCFYFLKDKQAAETGQNNEAPSSQYSCPGNIYEKSGGKYYIADSDAERDLGQKEVDWIKANCKDTIWPSFDQKPNKNGTQTNSQNSNSKCPRRVYGAVDSGYYGIYDMQQVDLTTEESDRVKKNCPDTYWIGDNNKPGMSQSEQ